MDQNSAFILSQAVCALIEAMGMMSENMQRQQDGESMAYLSDSFGKLIDQYGIGYNDVIGYLQRR